MQHCCEEGREVYEIASENNNAYNPVLFFVYLKKTIQFSKQINVKNVQMSIQYMDLNPRPFEHESSPITARPGLLPHKGYIYHTVLESIS